MLGFPCPQFNNQEPGGSAEEIMNGYHYVRPGNNFVMPSQLTLFEKGAVNGELAQPVYTFLRDRCDGATSVLGVGSLMGWTPITSSDITWNFEKFLIDKDGIPFRRYNPVTSPASMAADIATLLAAPMGSAPLSSA